MKSDTGIVHKKLSWQHQFHENWHSESLQLRVKIDFYLDFQSSLTNISYVTTGAAERL
jgi:hypothetical protein